MRQPTHLLYMSNCVLKLHRNIDSIPPNDFIMIEYVLVDNR